MQLIDGPGDRRPLSVWTASSLEAPDTLTPRDDGRGIVAPIRDHRDIDILSRVPDRDQALRAYAQDLMGLDPFDVIDLRVDEAGLTGVAFVLPVPASSSTAEVPPFFASWEEQAIPDDQVVLFAPWFTNGAGFGKSPLRRMRRRRAT